MTNDSQLYAVVHQVYDRARQLDQGARAAFLGARCATDPGLRAEVESLLAADQGPSEGTDRFSEEAIAKARASLERLVVDDEVDASWVPERIGGYRILQRVGEGGMGVVYEAEQDSPRRRVAIKLLHPLHATADRMRRFRQEAELLGRLHHPGIAQIFEAGTFDLGRGAQPYFAMQFVDGLDLRTYCEREHLDARARLELLARVCDAVEYAHVLGVVHRDIKPDNVLVDEHGQPKVLDFGIARASKTSAMLSTIVTDEGQLVGTLSYMAPEQLRASPEQATKRVDVYALGVLGFELLTGRLPHLVDDLPISAAVALLANTDATHASALDPKLRGDVDTILGKALESDPARRYASAAALAGDIRRHLEERPIRARPPSRVYLARKFVRRHRALVGGVVATVATLLVGVVVALALADRERTQRELADARELEARENETRAAGGLLQATHTALEAGRPWDAVASFARVPERCRGWAWRLLALDVPRVLEVPVLDWMFLDDEHLFAQDTERGRLFVYELDTDTLRELPVPEGLRADRRVWVSPDWIAVDVLADGAVALFDLAAGRVLGALPRAPGDSYTAALASDDGRVVAARKEAGGFQVWRDGVPWRSFPDVAADAWVRPSPDGRLLTVERAAGLEVIDVESGAAARVEPPGEGAEQRAYPFDGGFFLDRSGGGRPRSSTRVDLAPQRGPEGRPLLVHGEVDLNPSRESVVRWPRDGRFVALSGFTCRLRDGVSGEPLRRSRYANESGTISASNRGYKGFLVSPSGARGLVRGFADRPWLFDLDERYVAEDFDPRCTTLTGHRSWIYHLAVSHDGSLIASAAPDDALVRLWDGRTGEQVGALERRSQQPGSLDALLAFSADDERLVMTTPFGEHAYPVVVEWTLFDGSVAVHSPEARVGEHHGALLDPFLDVLRPGPRARLSQRAQILGDSALVASRLIGDAYRPREGVDEPSGRGWKLGSPALDVEGGVSLGLAVHPALARVAVVGTRKHTAGQRHARAGVLRITDAHSGAVSVERDMQAMPWCVAWSPDGSLIAVGADEGRVLLFETEFHTQVLDLRAHDDYVHSLAWLPDGERLVTASGDRTLKIWDPRRLEVKDAELARWRALRERMAARAELGALFPTLLGDERAAARVELVGRALGG